MQESNKDWIMAEERDEVLELQCNLDDMPPEELAYAMERLFDAGALDVYTVPIGMKKSRTGIMLSVLCRQEQKSEMAQLIFRHTTTIGIREYVCNRMILKRKEEVRETEYGSVRVKKTYGYGVEKEKLEYEDLKEIANRTGKSIGEIRKDLQENAES
ncbi:MAG: LarC family nickel insertion protein [Lachnospiraceae bacterium]|nr:LarC family nickel insertion protein [Lachnospiraceae bacterium]